MRSGMRNTAAATLCIVLLRVLSGSAVEEKADAQPKIAQVFFAQQHVQTPDGPYFKLVGNLEALVKVQVYSQTDRRSPAVCARLKLGSGTLELPLKGPAELPKPLSGDPLLMEQRYEDSFTAIIPREWIAPGLKVTVDLKEGNSNILDSVVFDKLNIGAPTKLVMTMFDFHFFGGDKDKDYPKGWFEELGPRLPVAEIELRRVRNIIFDKLVMRPQAGRPAILCGSMVEYAKKTGIGFDGEQAMTLKWNAALKEAAGAGLEGTRRLYYSNIYGVPCGGEAWGLSGVGNGKGQGYVLHELGHCFSLPDLSSGKALANYPYIGPMHGIPAPAAGLPHVGPTWGFDLSQRTFLSPVATNGQYRKDPMRGGGANEEGGPGIFRFFSDYHCSKIRDYLERTLIVRDESGRYLGWNQQSGSYSTVVHEKGAPSVPVEDDVDVISILASASLVTPEANIVYPPIGPYKAGYIRFFDATSAADRGQACTAGFDDSNCNVCLRVTQGGKVKTYLVKDKLSRSNETSFCVFAVNMPARDGAVTHADLLHTPGVMGKGIGPECKVLYRWIKDIAMEERNEL